MALRPRFATEKREPLRVSDPLHLDPSVLYVVAGSFAAFISIERPLTSLSVPSSHTALGHAMFMRR